MMSASNPTHATTFSIVFFFFISSFQLSYSVGNTTTLFLCPEIEKESLLSFKQSLKDPKNLLSSWDGEVINCCKWKGVICNNGHVHQLHLPGMSLDGKMNSSLLNLKYLTYLDLSRSDLLLGGTIPSFIGSFAKLEYLNMNFVNLSRANNWAHVINSLPSLVELHFEYCSLDFITPLVPDDVNVTTSLNHLYLSDNNNRYFSPSNFLSSNFLSSIHARWIFQITNLLSLDLSWNSFYGPIPTISNATKLHHIDLSANNFNSSNPNWFYLCKDLEYVDLSSNLQSGTISNSIANLTSLNTLLASGNQLSGHLTYQFGEFKSLRILDLGTNSFSGAIPFSIGELSSLEVLRLNDNKFTGTLPESLGQLFNLQILFIHDNLLEGIVTETHFANLTKLEELYAYGNHLTLNVSSNWNPPFQLKYLQIASWNLGEDSPIPSWIEEQKNIEYLDLSNTGISGSIPSWVWTIPILTLSNNHLHGKIQIADTMSLNLGGNQLSGELPDCWTKLPYLRYLNLSNNNMSGSIPNSFGFLGDLTYLNLYGNRLSGEIPSLMQNCTELVLMNLDLVQLTYLILRSNKLSGKISPEICLLNSLQVLDLSDNKLSGIIPSCLSNLSGMATPRYLIFYSIVDELEYGRTLSLVTNTNLSKNNLSGNIPKELIRLVELRSLNLSQNRLTGLIPEKIGDMKQLESLDFSMNSLSGQIPTSVALLSFLSYLNISYNNLTGEIPKSTQLLGLDASGFIGNSLCGPPLPTKCNDGGDERHEEKEENEEESKIEWVYVVASLGYAVGFSIVCSALVLNKSWREAYFGFLQSMWDKLYVYVYIKFNKLSARE
ncbi:hypothetical protein ACS0TY_036721 [Phlomoides rotata]